MSIKNKIMVEFFLEDGCSQEDEEVSHAWKPINFAIYHSMFPELIEMAIDDWLGENKVEERTLYEVIFVHEIEQDGCGAVTSEYFTPVLQESHSV